jgi:hypothetical protein
MSPRGWFLRIWLVEIFGQKGSCILMCESLRHDDITVIASPLLGWLLLSMKSWRDLSLRKWVLRATWHDLLGAAWRVLRGPASLNARPSM